MLTLAAFLGFLLLLLLSSSSVVATVDRRLPCLDELLLDSCLFTDGDIDTRRLFGTLETRRLLSLPRWSLPFFPLAVVVERCGEGGWLVASSDARA